MKIHAIATLLPAFALTPPAQGEPVAQEAEQAAPVQEEAAPADTPAAEQQADADEALILEGLAILQNIAQTLNGARTPALADTAATDVQGQMDKLQTWAKKLQTMLETPEGQEAFAKRYRPTMEKVCMAVSELSVQLVNAAYMNSEPMRLALLRVSKEMPQACGVRESVRWTCTGTVLLAMANETLAGISSKTTAASKTAELQGLADAMQPWRQAAHPEGAAQATRLYRKNKQTFVEQSYMRILMQAKRITYAEYFHEDGLALPLLMLTDSLADTCALSPEEQHICAGIVLLGVLENVLSQVKGPDSARAAIAPIMRVSNELQQWGQGFATLPEPDADTRRRYEKRYLPQIEQLNDRIKAQGERITYAEFYRCRELQTALLRLVMNFL